MTNIKLVERPGSNKNTFKSLPLGTIFLSDPDSATLYIKVNHCVVEAIIWCSATPAVIGESISFEDDEEVYPVSSVDISYTL